VSVRRSFIRCNGLFPQNFALLEVVKARSPVVSETSGLALFHRGRHQPAGGRLFATEGRMRGCKNDG
jgi:hypothetical protein